MKLLSALNQRLRELQLWQQETVLAIRQAFTFEDIAVDTEVPVPVLEGMDFTAAITKDGYGLYHENHWILARPDAATRQIVVTKFVEGRHTATRINTCLSVDCPGPNAVSDLRKEIIEFLAIVKLSAVPIEW